MTKTKKKLNEKEYYYQIDIEVETVMICYSPTAGFNLIIPDRWKDNPKDAPKEIAALIMSYNLFMNKPGYAEQVIEEFGEFLKSPKTVLHN